MKRNYLFYICMICVQALMVCACSDDYSTDVGFRDFNDGELRIRGIINSGGTTEDGNGKSGTAEDGVDSRLQHTDTGNSVKVEWSIDDKVSMVSARQPGMFYYKAMQTGDETLFAPEGDNTLNYIKGDTVFALYPFVENDFSYPRIAIPDLGEQSYESDDFPSQYDYIYAKSAVGSEDVELRFRHIFAFLKVKIKRKLIENARKLYIYSTDTVSRYDDKYGRRLCYNILEDKVEGTPDNSLWYYLPERLPDDKDEIICHIAILPIKGGEYMSLDAYDNDDNFKLLFKGESPEDGFKAGHVYTLNVEMTYYEEIEKREREALMALYNATDGDNWKNNTNWGSDKPLSEWANVYVWDNHVKYLDLNNNNLRGSIPEEMANLKDLEFIYMCGNYLSGEVPQKVLETDWWKEKGLDHIIYQRDGYKLEFPKYESTDYSQDGLVTTLQTHTIGNGLKLVILPEAFSDRMIADGSFLNYAKDAMEMFFEKEPYASFREYFDVYCVNVVSENEILYGNTAFKTSYDFYRWNFATWAELVADKVMKLKETNYKSADVTTIVIMNTKSPFRAVCAMFADGFSAGYVKISTREGMEQEIHHEVCGHGFGKLIDEYVEYDGVFPNPEIFEWYHSQNWYMNVDSENDPSRVQWSYFLSDMRYASEKLGIFEGAYYYPKGVYRSRETSIMGGDTDTFNAPSRQSIYRRIMELSGSEYSLEDFLEYDEINRKMFDSGAYSRSTTGVSYDIKERTVPPVVFDYPSSEAVRRSVKGRTVKVPLR